MAAVLAVPKRGTHKSQQSNELAIYAKSTNDGEGTWRQAGLPHQRLGSRVGADAL